MALGERYRRVANEKQWEAFDASIEALSDDLAEVERIIAAKTFSASQVTSGVFARARLGSGTADATTVLYGDGTWKTAPSPATAVAPYLPPADTAGRSRSQTRIYIDASTQWPIRVTWTEPTTLRLVVQNPATNTSNLNVGYGNYGNHNHTSEPDVVPPGSEWVGYASPLPVFCRFTTGTGHVLVLTERSA